MIEHKYIPQQRGYKIKPYYNLTNRVLEKDRHEDMDMHMHVYVTQTEIYYTQYVRTYIVRSVLFIKITYV